MASRSHPGFSKTNTAIRKITGWLEKQGYSIQYSENEDDMCQCDPNSLIVSVNRNLDEKQRLYSLLHEAGHAQLFNLDDYDTSFDQIAIEHQMPHADQSNLFRYQRLKEELLAWEAGLLIADKLKIKIDINDYDKYAADNYMSYVLDSSLHHYTDIFNKVLKANDLNLEIKFTENFNI